MLDKLHVHPPSSQPLCVSPQLARDDPREHRRPWPWKLVARARDSRRDRVLRLRRRRLRQVAEGIVPGSSEVVAIFNKKPPAAVELVDEFIVSSPSPTSPPTPFASR